MITRIQETVARVLEQRALDSRTCFSRVREDGPGGGRIVVECSDGEVLAEVRRRVGAAGGDLEVAYIALPRPENAVSGVLIVSNSVADVRKGPSHAAELVTEIICGDEVTPLLEEEEWVLARLDDGYTGWIRSWHLVRVGADEIAAFRREARYRVRDNIIQLFESPGEASQPVCDAVVGTRLIVEPSPKRGWRRAVLPDGRAGFAPSRVLERFRTHRRIDRDRLAATGLRFLGIPYLWGGATPKGFDCSGLTQRIFRLHGVLIPRDSDMQSLVGKSKTTDNIDALNTGDLLFFGKEQSQITHVAMYLSDGFFLHAQGRVRVGTLKSAHFLFDKKLVGEWQFSRDPLSI